MERLPLGKGRFLITLTPEEICDIKRLTKMSMHLALKAAAIVEAEKSGTNHSNNPQVAESKARE
jgi:hypothetical protein